MVSKDTATKYGIVRDKYGNFRIGQYKFVYQSGRYFLDMRGVITRKGGIEDYAYGQWIEQMLPSDYPFEISEEVFYKINNIIRSNITEVENILSLQPKQERTHQPNSKFFLQTWGRYYVCSVKSISDITDYEFCDEIMIEDGDFLRLKYSSTTLITDTDIDTDNCFYLSDSIYDYIKGKALQLSVLLKNLCASIYNPSALDVEVLSRLPF